MNNGIRASIGPLLAVAAFLLGTRVAFADFVVNTASDTINPSCGTINGTCSLRDAIILSQGAGGSIHFAIGTGHQTINLMSNLPVLIEPTTIDGRTQPGYAGVPLIEIRRADAGNAWRGLHIGQPPAVTSCCITVKALVINHFSGVCADCGGIVMDNVGGNYIQGCYIGTDATGMVADGNSTAILDNTYGGNIYGSGPVAYRNVISGNSNGIVITAAQGGYTAKNIIQGNYFGLNALGTAEVHNGGAIFVGPPAPGYSPGILIGGPLGSGAGNVFAGIGGSGVGIQINTAGDINATNNVIQGNIIGLDPTGLVSLPIQNGIVLMGDTSDKILDNVISVTGNAIEFLFSVAPTTGTKVQGNYIGTDITGNRVPIAGGYGINFSGGQNNTIGGSAPGEGNVIGGFLNGIVVGGGMSTGNVILGNRIGIGVNGLPIPNLQAGIFVQSSGETTIGGINPGEGNIIASNGVRPLVGQPPAVPGVAIQNVTANVIRGNSIFGNLGKGIDFTFPFSHAPYPNTPGGPHIGPNRGQNFPLITSVTFPDSAHARIQGTLNTTTGLVMLDFYANPTPVHPGDLLQGQTWIGFDQRAADSQGNASFDITFPVSGIPNVWISATATDGGNNTSEFSARSLFSVTPTHGPASGGTPTTLKGQLFQSGAVIRFGGTVTTNTGFIDASTITAVSPLLPAGLLLDVSVTNPDASQAVMQNAWVSDFLDVPNGSALYPWITALAGDGVTAGCGGGNYCPNNNVTRAQMAVFLLRAKYGPWWTPPAATGTVFADVPAGAFAAAWIEELNHEGVAGGCGGGNYCPNNPVTRAQMAVFLLRTRNGPLYNPPPCTGIFNDVACMPTPAFAVNWIEQLYVQGISGGCSSSPLLYCPTNNVTRGQMAVFIVTTFRLL